MMYSYPFFSFPRFRRYTASTTPPAQVPYSNYVPHPSYGNVSASNRPFVPSSTPYARSKPISPTSSKSRNEERKNRENSTKLSNRWFRVLLFFIYTRRKRLDLKSC